MSADFEIDVPITPEAVDVLAQLFPPPPRVGQNVVFLGCTESQQAWGHGYIDHGVLTEGDVYWVSRIEEHTWHTKVWLGEGDLGPFNSVCFAAVPDPNPGEKT